MNHGEPNQAPHKPSMHLDEAREARLQLVLKVPQGWRRFAALRYPEREFTYDTQPM